MAINQKELKLLWGRSGNRCAICKKLLTQDKEAVTGAFTLGEQAHIIGEKSDAPRGDSTLSTAERNSYHNLILLCPTHHTEIDKNTEDWPVEKLHITKSKHELWVMETLSESVDLYKIAQETSVTNIIDTAVVLCDLEHWKEWTSGALAPDPHWNKDKPEDLFKFRLKVMSAIWPNAFDELRRSATTLSFLLNEAAMKFMEHSELIDDLYWAFKFYKRFGWNENYDEDLRQYESWLNECYALIRESSKAANWFADVVRRDINPMFFADKGKFLIVEGPFEDLTHRTSLLEYTQEEILMLPGRLQDV